MANPECPRIDKLNDISTAKLYDRTQTANRNDQILGCGSGTTKAYVSRQLLVTTSPLIV